MELIILIDEMYHLIPVTKAMLKDMMIVAKVDEITEVVDITNHEAGTNPYYEKGVNTTQVGPSPMVKGCGCSSGGGCDC